MSDKLSSVLLRNFLNMTMVRNDSLFILLRRYIGVGVLTVIFVSFMIHPLAYRFMMFVIVLILGIKQVKQALGLRLTCLQI
jgi:hypothetical protein